MQNGQTHQHSAVDVESGMAHSPMFRTPKLFGVLRRHARRWRMGGADDYYRS